MWRLGGGGVWGGGGGGVIHVDDIYLNIIPVHLLTPF